METLAYTFAQNDDVHWTLDETWFAMHDDLVCESSALLSTKRYCCTCRTAIDYQELYHGQPSDVWQHCLSEKTVDYTADKERCDCHAVVAVVLVVERRHTLSYD